MKTNHHRLLRPCFSWTFYWAGERLPSSGEPSILSTTPPYPTQSLRGWGSRVRHLPVAVGVVSNMHGRGGTINEARETHGHKRERTFFLNCL